jgi:hypothetical protein
MQLDSIRKMVLDVALRLAESFRKLVIERSRQLNPVAKVLLFAFAILCYPLVSVILVIIMLLVICVAIPVSFVSRR